jgi:NAD(P)-dependent dehydrogenase (short-subunit alcohol dehydrogenase family)
MGRVVAITGAARGIGRATARALLAGGAQVAIGDVDAEALRAASFDGPAYPLDVTDPASFERFVAAVEDDLGPLDVLINNAGVLAAGPIADEADEITRRILDVNLLGVITGTKVALRSMLPRGTGHIVNLASISGETYGGGEATYCASKFGVVGFTDAARFELHGRGVRFTLVMPALVDTELTAGSGRLLFVNRRVSPDDVAAAIVRVLRRPRRRVYVPASLGVAVRLRRFVPAQVSDAAAALIGARSMFIDVDHEVRDAYERRLRG